ncbi:MAG TPA: hypothetical protein VL463_25905 [Kofleriaceae bacterium]|nr:hypothetical protein [Kofleriaceae bacterium]
MRGAIVVAGLAVAGIAHAEARAPRPRDATRADASFAHVIYMNRCAGGCAITPGDDDARIDHSTVPTQTSILPAYPWGDLSWNQLVACVRDTYAPFAIEITDVDPGTAPHFELMVGGNDTDVQIDGALGVAPFIPCGGIFDNVITFVFAAETSDVDVLCWAAAQETSHVLGLDHELDADDPMTYLYPPYSKRFQNHDAACGEDLPRECACGGETQNTVHYLASLLGETTPSPPEVSITSPKNGAWVKATFAVIPEVVSISDVKSATAAVDGAPAGGASAAPWTVDVTSPPGPHVVTLTIANAATKTASAEVSVHVMSTCAAGCAAGSVCLGGACVPDASVVGGLGAACTGATPCAVGSCVGGVCAEACDPGGVCPAGYECTAADQVCAPVKAGGGGCSAGGGGGMDGVIGIAIGVGGFRRRRRRRQGQRRR